MPATPGRIDGKARDSQRQRTRNNTYPAASHCQTRTPQSCTTTSAARTARRTPRSGTRSPRPRTRSARPSWCSTCSGTAGGRGRCAQSGPARGPARGAAATWGASWFSLVSLSLPVEGGKRVFFFAYFVAVGFVVRCRSAASDVR